MDISTKRKLSVQVGERIKRIRRAKGLTQAQLAEGNFTKGYVSALERGAVRPSFKALESLARRLDVPVEDFLSASQELGDVPDLSALQEDLLFQSNYAKLLIRSALVKEAFQLIDEMRKQAEPHIDMLPPSITYLVPFLRGRAYLQISSPNLARPELEAALTIARNDLAIAARIRNLLGVVYYELSQPHLALEHHLFCLEQIRSGIISDLNFSISVYRNLANDYWVLNEPIKSIATYKEALPLLNDLSDMEQQAWVFWGMAMAYKQTHDLAQAKLYSVRALTLYETSDNRAEAASICLHLAETLTEEKRFGEALELLGRAEKLLEGTGNKAVSSYLFRDYAELELRQGNAVEAVQYAQKSLEQASAYYEAAHSGEEQEANVNWNDSIRTYAEALAVSALSQVAVGDNETADLLFEQALEVLSSSTLEEAKHNIYLQYAKILQGRGAFEKAASIFRMAAELRPFVSQHGGAPR